MLLPFALTRNEFLDGNSTHSDESRVGGIYGFSVYSEAKMSPSKDLTKVLRRCKARTPLIPHASLDISMVNIHFVTWICSFVVVLCRIPVYDRYLADSP
ncbi:hypothetical protein PROFUN_03122 [Planoprotostelium fungivorum]|uniref:Uncharacterized protein n=1 Tax=Planoprotostelium fungivorum TaxID=1890364 RepID=A0A2P6NQA7_9EUKA|nr:hypothetical protein PROFUN_03122 [Planoprotostelium fungivorum]